MLDLGQFLNMYVKQQQSQTFSSDLTVGIWLNWLFALYYICLNWSQLPYIEIKCFVPLKQGLLRSKAVFVYATHHGCSLQTGNNNN